jgi:hypothetical protein
MLYVVGNPYMSFITICPILFIGIIDPSQPFVLSLNSLGCAKPTGIRI